MLLFDFILVPKNSIYQIVTKKGPKTLFLNSPYSPFGLMKIIFLYSKFFGRM